MCIRDRYNSVYLFLSVHDYAGDSGGLNFDVHETTYCIRKHKRIGLEMPKPIQKEKKDGKNKGSTLFYMAI